MTDQPPLFVHTLLEWRLQERLAEALKTISTLPREDVLRCDSGCLTEIIRQFAVAPPILRVDSIVADEEIGEAEDLLTGRKIGLTNHSYFIPIEREPVPLCTENPRETVRKGYEQQSEREFGHYTEHKMAQEASPMRPLRLRWERLQDFSDSLRGGLLGNSAAQDMGFSEARSFQLRGAYESALPWFRCY